MIQINVSHKQLAVIESCEIPVRGGRRVLDRVDAFPILGASLGKMVTDASKVLLHGDARQLDLNDVAVSKGTIADKRSPNARGAGRESSCCIFKPLPSIRGVDANSPVLSNRQRARVPGCRTAPAKLHLQVISTSRTFCEEETMLGHINKAQQLRRRNKQPLQDRRLNERDGQHLHAALLSPNAEPTELPVAGLEPIGLPLSPL